MAILTLTTDFGLKDHYVAAVKGAVYSQLPDVTIVDISHQVMPFNVREAAFHVKNVYKYFPKGTVHLIGVRAELSDEAPHRLVLFDGHYFVAADTGVFRLMFNREPDAVYDLNLPSDSDVLTFPVLHVFVKAVCHILRGGTPEVIGKKTKELTNVLIGAAMETGDSIRGHVVHIDHYDNLMTDIHQNLFREVGLGRPCNIHLRTKRKDIKRISQRYGDVSPGSLLALFNTEGYLEIAVNGGAPGVGGGAAQLLGLKNDDIILIVFETPENQRETRDGSVRLNTELL